MYIYIHIYTCIHINIYTYINTYLQGFAPCCRPLLYCWGFPLTPYHAPREDCLCSRLLIICARLLNKCEVSTKEGLGPVLGSCSFVLTCAEGG